MSNRSSVVNLSEPKGVTVSFGERFQASEQFDQVFREGMALVEEAATYLDGQGRRDSKKLKGADTVLYASESMRLTTRLLDLASWLLIRRSLKEGEISRDEAEAKRKRVKLQGIGRPSHVKDYEKLPQGLRSLIERSFGLHDRIIKLDRAMNDPAAGDGRQVGAKNPVAAQIVRLHEAFGG